MFEYAISKGPGTLIDYGTFIDMDHAPDSVFIAGLGLDTLVIEECPDDCETGE